jgi:elongation factor P hydroxylase
MRCESVVRPTRSLTDLEIAGCFNSTLGPANRVRLIGGGNEPLYQPPCYQPPCAAADHSGSAVGTWAIIRYTRDYPLSVLHELAHWSLAGRRRRDQLDYGYWYTPPPRTAEQQLAFLAVEERVQAVELLLAGECGLRFRVSVDDVGGCQELERDFAQRVAARSEQLRSGTLPVRARQLLNLFSGRRAFSG